MHETCSPFAHDVYSCLLHGVRSPYGVRVQEVHQCGPWWWPPRLKGCSTVYGAWVHHPSSTKPSQKPKRKMQLPSWPQIPLSLRSAPKSLKPVSRAWGMSSLSLVWCFWYWPCPWFLFFQHSGCCFSDLPILGHPCGFHRSAYNGIFWTSSSCCGWSVRSCLLLFQRIPELGAVKFSFNQLPVTLSLKLPVTGERFTG